MPAPFLGWPVEICIVTADLHATLAGLVQLGIGPFKIYRFSPATVSEQTFRGAPSEFEIEVAFAEQAGMVWEVMRPISGPSVMRDFLVQTGGRGGIQHVAFEYPDVATKGEGVAKGPLVGQAARIEASRRRKEFESRGELLLLVRT